MTTCRIERLSHHASRGRGFLALLFAALAIAGGTRATRVLSEETAPPLSPPEGAPAIRSVILDESGRLRLAAEVPPRQRFLLQCSPDLAHWRSVPDLWLTSPACPTVEIDVAPAKHGFYRLAREATMFRFNPRRTGVCETDGIPGTTNAPTLKWKFQTGAGIFSSPAVLGGVVYVGSLDTNFYAIDAESGAERWRFRTDGPIRSSPAVVDGTVYFYSRDGLVYALQASNGQEAWRCRIAETNQTRSFDDYEYFDSSPTVVDGVLYIGSGDKHLYAIQAETGQVLWKFPVNGKVSSPPAVAGGTVYFGVTDGNFFALDAVSGTQLWKFKTQGNSGNGYPKGDVLHAPVVVDGQVFFGSRDSAVYALDAATGVRKWRRDIMGGYNWAANSPAVWNGLLLIGSSITGALVAIDTSTGIQKWQVSTYQGLALYSSPAIAEGVAYFGTGNVQVSLLAPAHPRVMPGYLQAVDLATGKNKWKYRVEGHVWSSPAVVEGTVYFGCLDGHIYALKAAPQEP
jgi:outer membrane protein assembly factor BamB